MFNPVRCVVFFCTDPVARFWLVCNLVFVAALTARSHVRAWPPDHRHSTWPEKGRSLAQLGAARSLTRASLCLA